MYCQFVSARPRGTLPEAPNEAKLPTKICGRPKSLGFGLLAGHGAAKHKVSNPILAGSKLLSCGVNVSAKRFHPPRTSISNLGEITCV